MELGLQKTRAAFDRAFRASKLGEARRLQGEILKIRRASGDLDSNDLLTAAIVEFNDGEHADALSFLQAAAALSPNDGQILWNIATTLFLLGDFETALVQAERALVLNPDYDERYSILTRIHGRLGNQAEMLKFGVKALEGKDRLADAAAAVSIPNRPPPPFDAGKPHRNIIAFSLWGEDLRYLDGALKNARLRPYFYPEWTLRFYCQEDVNEKVLSELRQLGAQVVLRRTQKLIYEGLFWRFIVSGEKDVDRFLIRDTDSVFSVKERAAVDEWLRSDRYFHVMRDHYEQIDPIDAGLWGGIAGVLPPIGELLGKFKPTKFPTRMIDQMFLAELVWPTVRQSCLLHDSVFSLFGAKPFPPFGPLPPGGFLGAGG